MRRGVGFVPQNNNVFPSLTIEENLRMGMFQTPKRFGERFDFIATSSRPWATAVASAPAPCPAASGRWSRWRGRS